MYTTIDYSASPSPAFDAVEDVIQWFGERYSGIATEMCKVTDRKLFEIWCNFAGVQGFPVRAWYEHFHGQGSWEANDE